MDFIVQGLSAKPFRHLYGKSDCALEALGVKRYVADSLPGFPDRIGMRDVEIGESVLLLNHTSMAQSSPYRATHAIFIHEGAEQTYTGVNTIPDVMSRRLLSLRAFDAKGMMLDAEIAQGDEIEAAVLRLLAQEDVLHIDAHNAIRGCYSGRIVRA